jgi:hypothetical protein
MTTTQQNDNNKYLNHLKELTKDDHKTWTFGNYVYLNNLDKDLLIDILDYCQNDDELKEMIDDDASGVIHQIADAKVDIYYYDLAQWLATSNNNGFIVNDAVNEFGLDTTKEFDIFKAIALGQYKFYHDEIHTLVIKIRNEIDEINKNN